MSSSRKGQRLKGGKYRKTAFGSFSRMPPKNQASVGHPPRSALFSGFGASTKDLDPEAEERMLAIHRAGFGHDDKPLGMGTAA